MKPGNSSVDAADRPPVLGSWRRIYGIVILTLVLLIVLFYFFSRAFA